MCLHSLREVVLELVHGVEAAEGGEPSLSLLDLQSVI